MATRWEDRLRAAQQLRFESSPLGRLAAALGISSSWMWRLKFGERALLRFGWSVVPRKLKLVAGAVAATWLMVAVAALATVVFVFVQLS